MSYTITAQHVLNDIEFELAQGAISKDDLGRAVVQIKQHQNKLRTEIFQPGHDLPALREIVGRQFQLNDMLITMLQETAAVLQEMQLKTERVRQWRETAVPPTLETPTTIAPPDDSIWRDTDELETVMVEPLAVKLEAQPSAVPLIGPFLQRIKQGFHGLVIFYLHKLAEKQTVVNRTYGRWLLYADALHHHHQNEIHQLQTQLAALQARLDAAGDLPDEKK